MAPGPEDLLSFLSSTELFHHAGDSALREIARSIDVLTLSRGSVVDLTGASADNLYLVVEGMVAATARDPFGNVSFQGTAGPGEAAVPWSLVSGQCDASELYVLQDCAVVRLPNAAFQAFAQQDAESSARIIESASKNLRRSRLRHALQFADFASDMDPAALRHLESELELVTFSSGQVLMTQGDPGDCLYIVINGRVRVISKTERGTDNILAELGLGETVGEMALLGNTPRTATVVAIRDTFTGRLSKAAFDRFVDAHPHAALKIFAGKLVARLGAKAAAAQQKAERVLTIAVAATHPDAPLAGFARHLHAALSELGPAWHLNSGGIDRLMGRPGSAQAPEDSAQSLRLVEWLNELELRHRYVVYECDPSATPWTQRALRQADHILLVADATSDSAPGEVESGIARSQSSAPISLVLLHPQKTAAGTAAWLRPRSIERHFHVEVDSLPDVRRVARFLTGRAFGLTLGGGFARGLTHLGVIRALAERGIVVDAIGGNSMGAVLAAQYAQGWDIARMLHETAEGCAACIGGMTLPMVAFKTGGKFSALIQKFNGGTQIEDLWVPYFCVSANLTRAELQVHRQGSLTKAILASSRVPGVFPPVVYEGDLHIDGGILNNVPVDVMRGFTANGIVMGVDAVPNRQFGVVPDYGFELTGWREAWARLNPFNGRRSSIPSILQIMLRAIEFGGVYQKRLLAASADIYLRPPLQGFKPTDFRFANEIVEAGYQTAMRSIENWLNNPAIAADRKPVRHD